MVNESKAECPPLPIFRPDEDPSTETDCLKDAVARKLYEDAAPATALIKLPLGTGSGFFIGDGSQVVTNAHVVEEQRSLITVRAHGGETYRARIEKLDDINDLAILRLEEGAHHPAVLEVGSSESLAEGDSVYALGHPKGRSDTYISPGAYEGSYRFADIDPMNSARQGSSRFITNLERAGAAHGKASEQDLQALNDSERQQNSARSQHGGSGSPMINGDGQVVGILANGPIDNSMPNYSWAVPADRLQELMQPDNQKFTFHYQDASLFRAEPIFMGVMGGGVSAAVIRAPRIGGTAVGVLSLALVPECIQALMEPKHETDQLYGSLGLASTAGFVSGAALSYFDRTKVLGRAAHAVGLTGFIGQAFVPRSPFLTEIKRTNGETRPPFMWRG